MLDSGGSDNGGILRDVPAEPFQQRTRIVNAPLHVGFDVGEGVGARTPASLNCCSDNRFRPATATTGIPAAPGRRGHPGRGLAVQGLLVQRSLPGDHQVGAVQLAANPVSSSIRSMPGRAVACSTAIAANPTPPAAPAPAISAAGCPDGPFGYAEGAGNRAGPGP